jgi:hypothetical protein
VAGVAGSDKGQRERWGSAQFGAHFFGRRADARFVETVQNKAGDGAVHELNLPWAAAAGQPVLFLEFFVSILGFYVNIQGISLV